MKRAVVLHGTSSTPDSNWFPWLKTQLEALDYEVWVPQLPAADHPNAKHYTDFLLGACWDFSGNLIIGHSSGAVEILHLLQHLPDATTIATAVLVGAFSGVLADEPDWKQLKGLFEEPFNFEIIRQKAAKLLFVHGSDDPWCDPKQAQLLSEHLGGEYVEISGGKHFTTSLDPAFAEFPALMDILKSRQLV